LAGHWPTWPKDRSYRIEDKRSRSGSQPETESRTITLDRGDSFQGVLTDAGVPDADADAVVAVLTKVFDTRKTPAGLQITLTFESRGEGYLGRLLSASFSPSVEHNITIRRNADNSFTANDEVKQLVARTRRAGGTYNGSLYLAGMQAGIPAGIMVDMIKLFGAKIDFQRLRPGDTFEVYYSFYYTTDGLPAREGNIDYAAVRTRGKEYSGYRFQPDPDKAAEYYDGHGVNLRDGSALSGFTLREFLLERLHTDALLASSPLELKVRDPSP
jgi:hypothetical protein